MRKYNNGSSLGNGGAVATLMELPVLHGTTPKTTALAALTLPGIMAASAPRGGGVVCTNMVATTTTMRAARTTCCWLFMFWWDQFVCCLLSVSIHPIMQGKVCDGEGAYAWIMHVARHCQDVRYVLLAVDSIKWSDGGSSWRHTPPMLFYLSSSPGQPPLASVLQLQRF